MTQESNLSGRILTITCDLIRLLELYALRSPGVESQPILSEPLDTPSTSRPEIEALRERLRSVRLGQEDLQRLDRLLGTLLNLIALL